MDTEKCRILLTTLKAGSMSKAAEILGYTPSGILRAIKSLEEDVGLPLLLRTPRGVTVTKEGEKILPALKEILHQEQFIKEMSADLRGLVTGELNIGTFFSVAANLMPPILSDFRKKFPGIRINLVQAGNKELRERFAGHELDAAIISRQSYEGPWIPLLRDELMVWLPENHPLSSLPAFPLKQLEKEPFIDELPGEETDIWWLSRKENLHLNIAFTSIDNYAAYKMVEAGLGITLNNRLMTATWQGKVKVLPLNPPQYIELGMAVPEVISPALGKFIEYVRKAV